MSEETSTQQAENQPKAYAERPVVEKQTSAEVATQSQEKDLDIPDYGQLVQESKKYRKRAQESEAELTKLQKKLETDRQKQMEEQNKWQELAQERAAKLAELEPIVEKFKADEAQQRETLLADFSEEDRVQFGNLSLSQLRALHNKFFENKNSVTPTDTGRARTANVANKPWTQMSSTERKNNWANIVGSYMKK